MTAYTTSSKETRKHWAKKTFKELLTETYAFRFAGDSTDAMMEITQDLKKEKGDTVKSFLRAQLAGRGVVNGATVEGNTESLSFHDNSTTLFQLRHGVKSEGKLSEQRVAWEFRPHAKDALKDWWRKRIDVTVFNHLTGNTAETDQAYIGGNTIVAPTRVIMEADATASVSSGTTFGVRLIDYAVEEAKTGTYPMRPINVGGKDYFILFLHEYAWTDLRREFGTGGYADLQKAVIQGGAGTNNPLFTGAQGVYNNVVIHTTNYLPRNVTTAAGASTGSRAVLAGAQALTLAFGQKSDVDTYMNWSEIELDHGDKTEIVGGMIWGLKKNVFNGVDFSTVVIPHYCVSHA